MTLFHVLPLAGLFFGLIYGFKLGSRFGLIPGIVAAILGGGCGWLCGRVPFVLVLKLFQRDLGNKTIEDLRAMLRDPASLAPNVVLLELGSRGYDLAQELPAVLDMLASPTRQKRIRGWHALASAFPEHAKLLTDYRIDDTPDECRKKVQKLISHQHRPVS